ncbi:MAG: T9SS type A sorting domain-containing protein, partial [Sphingobacteriales bacterium]
KITGENYSMRWTGNLEAQYSETYTFHTSGSGGFRLWIDGQQLIDSWVDRASNDDVVTSKPIRLQAGQKYSVKLEHMNLGGARACHLYWECPSLGRMVHIPQSQLYTDATTGGRPPVQNQVPVANAGEDIVINLPVTQAVLNGSQSSDPDGQIVSYNWSKISGPDSYNIANSDRVQTGVSGLAAGTYAFRLRVTDDKGGVHEDDVTVTVRAAAQAPVANAGADTTITLPVNKVALSASSSTAPGGSITAYKWTKVSGPANFNIANDTAVNTEVNGLVQGVYSFRLRVTNDRGATHEDDIVITVNAATPGNQSPVANAGQDVTITLPQNSVTLDGRASRDPDGNITSYKWLMVNGPAAYSISNADSSVTSVINLAAGVYTFRLLVTDDKNGTHTDDVTVTVNPAASGGNQGSIANAGPDLFVTWPTNRTVLDGRASSVPGGSITRYRWSYVSGPSTYNISNNGAAETKLEDLREGVYVFQLTITDNRGATYSDNTTVTVSRNAAPQTPQNQAPVARAGQSMQITLPTNRVIVDGSGSSDADGFIAAYQWSKISGPSQFSIARSTSAATEISGLAQGVYVFRLTVTDDKGLTNAADVSVSVLAATTQQPEPEPEQPQQPGTFRVTVGADIRVLLPAKEITMSGVATGARVVSYRWSKVSGGDRYNIVSNSSPSTLLQDLSPGVFTFRLTATDDQGRQAYDDVTITISNSLARTDLTPTLNAGVWPNPSSTNFNLNVVASSDSPIVVKVHNQWGQTIRIINGVKNNSTIAVGGELSKGQYFLIAEQGDLKKIIKIINHLIILP